MLFLGYEGELVDAVVPFMGESVTDGTLANFLKRMLFNWLLLSLLGPFFLLKLYFVWNNDLGFLDRCLLKL